ncbi:MAG TPA: hypothetical protein VN924_03295 [Bryobacteraceae bacterium]|nr:hypothetical protein [Bryobacteraceae bacterium]
MIQAIHNQRIEVMEKPEGQTAPPNADFAALFGAAAKPTAPAAGVPSASVDPVSNPAVIPVPVAQTAAGAAGYTAWFGAAAPAAITATAAPSPSVSGPASTAPAIGTSLGDPDVQGWLNSYYAEQGAPSDANISYQPAAGAGNNYAAGTVYSPDAIYTQALANQDGNSFATSMGDNAAEFTSQLPGIPSQQVQQQFDQDLALENAGRLASGQAIDTTAYWSDPGSITMGGQTYTAQQLGYAGPGQSSGPLPIYISEADRNAGTDTFSVGGYTGTVTGIQPGKFYTLQQLEQAGLPAGQSSGQFQPGSWTTTANT